MSNKILAGQIYDLTKEIMKQASLSPQIIFSHQNAPRPKEQTLIISYTPIRSEVAYAQKSEVRQVEDDRFERDVFQHQETDFSFTEVHGEGDTLLAMLQYLESEEIKSRFLTPLNISYRRHGDIMSIPRLDMDDWTRESRLEITFSSLIQYIEKTAVIETVDYQQETVTP